MKFNHQGIVIVSKLIGKLYGLKNIKVDDVLLSNNILTIKAYSTKRTAACNKCHKKSINRRSSYYRKIMDLPIAGYQVLIQLRVFRYKCNNLHCDKKIFSETFELFANKYSRRSTNLNNLIEKIIVEVSSNKASYLLKSFNLPISGSTCLRIIKSMQLYIPKNLVSIGIDDWAKKKGKNYGSIVVNSQTGKTIDLIESRNESDVISWLKNYPQIGYVTRDRSAIYASAITKALPNAFQIADKFHLMKNLSEAITKDIKSQYSNIKKEYRNISMPEKNIVLVPVKLDDNQVYKAINELRYSKYLLYKELKNKGLNISSIARQTKTDRQTVRRYLKEGIPKMINRSINNYNSYLKEISDLCRDKVNISAMYRELKVKGLTGCLNSFMIWFNQRFPNYNYKKNRNYLINSADTDNRDRYIIPTFKKLSILIMNKYYGISKKTGALSDDRIIVDVLINKMPILKDLQDKYMEFKEILNGNVIDKLERWRIQTNEHSCYNIKKFSLGLSNDWKAISNAIAFKCTNSLIEGCINRLKNKKREMYGRAGIELLRRKVCLSVMG